MLRNIGTTIAIAAIALVGLGACQPVTAPEGPPAEDILPIGAPAPEVTTTTSTTTAPPLINDSWKLVGGDEFDGAAVDTTRWKPYHNTYGDGNHELACLTPANVAQRDGALTITARRETRTCPSGSVRDYTSGFLGSRETGTYYPLFGRFEMRAKVPHAQGLWPAFWLRHRNGASVAEVDIMEYFHASFPGKTYATLHLDGRHNLSKDNVAVESPQGPSGWHTWAVEISPAGADGTDVRFEFSMDGHIYHSYVDTQHNWASSDPNATWDIAVNLAVGGDWTGDPDGTLGYLRGANRCAIGGTAPNGCITTGINRVDWTDPAATSYAVDYVRVFTR